MDEIIKVLKIVQHTLNDIPNTKLKGEPYGYKNSYEVASRVDQLLKELENGYVREM